MSEVATINANGYFEESAPLQTSSTKYKIDTCLFAEKTDYSQTVVVKSPDYGTMLFLDGELQSTSYDEAIYHETLVHPIMNSLSEIQDKCVLVVGGAEGATVREVLKWNTATCIDWVDIDKSLVEVCKTHLKYCDESVYNDGRVNQITCDIMKHLERITTPTYDVIIIDLPDPDPEMGTPLYGYQFWCLIHRALKPGGGIVSHCGPVEPGKRRQVGTTMIKDGSGIDGFTYHTLIPSFQGDWGFWMTVAPSKKTYFPESCRIMDDRYQNTIFHWDKHWLI